MAYEGATEWLYDMKHYIKYDEQAEALDIAIESILRQIPKKPSMFDERGNVTATDRCCKCHKVIYNKYSYCPYCGQAVDWEDE